MLALKALARATNRARIALKIRDILSEHRTIVSSNQRYFSQYGSAGQQAADANSIYRANFENLQRKQGETSHNAPENTNNSNVSNNQANQASESVIQENGTLKMESVDPAKVKKTVENHLKDAVSDSFVSKAFRYCRDVYEETFPAENYDRKKSLKKKQAKVQRMTTKENIEYTEEELEKIQQEIPEWKNKSLVTLQDGKEEKPSLARTMALRIKKAVNNTETAQKFYKSEEYKEYEEFRTNMVQFKADLKDHMHQSENILVQSSVALIDKVKSESSTARAIKEMRKIDPSFDIYDLERDARGIFNDIYASFLQGDLERIEKQCSDMALGYFKVLLKKRQADKVEPKFKELWEVESADLVGGQIPENKFPMFTFTIKTQEIYCNVSAKDGKIVEGAEDRLMNCQYNFVLAPHQNPDLEEIGHGWELVEINQIGNTYFLV